MKEIIELQEQRDWSKFSYKKFIEKNFLVLDRETQKPVPFEFNKVQDKYYEMLRGDYPSDLEGIREIILKARQMGYSSLILALFAVDFLLRPYSVSICISHRRDATELLFKKVKFYIESYLRKKADKKGWKYDESMMDDMLKVETKGMMENAMNSAMFYIGTAGTKVGGRGGSARNVHYSEGAFFEDTELITAQEIILATSQQVPQGKGMIFIESTANGEGNFYHQEWERACDGKSIYKPRFFGWQEFYGEAWIKEKRKEFPTQKLADQEYPPSASAAFISSGSPYFDAGMLEKMLDKEYKPIEFGLILPDGHYNQGVTSYD